MSSLQHLPEMQYSRDAARRHYKECAVNQYPCYTPPQQGTQRIPKEQATQNNIADCKTPTQLIFSHRTNMPVGTLQKILTIPTTLAPMRHDFFY